MSGLPEGWKLAEFAELLAVEGVFSDGDWVESKDQDPNGVIRLLQLADIGDGKFLNKSNRFINGTTFEELRCTELAKNDVLIARMPDPLGRACLMPEFPLRCITVVDVAVFRPGKSGVEPRWLMHSVNAPQFRAQIEANASGTTRKRISRGNLAKLSLPVPPRSEQKRIADKLDSVLARVDACRDGLDRIPILLKRFRQSVLAAATTGRLTEGWREEKHLEWKPGHHCVADLGDVVTGNTPSKREAVAYGGTIPFYKPSDLDVGYRVESASEYLTEVGAGMARLLPERTVLVTCIGATIGKTGLSRRSGATNQQINAVVCNENVIPEWLFFWFTGPYGQAAITRNASATTLPILNKSKFGSLRLEVPAIAEQHEIVRRVETLFAFADRLEARCAAARKQAGQLTPALLAKAFRGELVPQDPADEPAAELLKRLAARRAEAPKARRGKPRVSTGG